jgi:hypothetical protein
MRRWLPGSEARLLRAGGGLVGERELERSTGGDDERTCADTVAEAPHGRREPSR